MNKLALVISEKTGASGAGSKGGRAAGQPSSVVVQVKPQLGNERTIKITEKRLDPLAPPKYKAKKLAKEALGDPTPIVRSPTKKDTSSATDDFLANMIGVGASATGGDKKKGPITDKGGSGGPAAAFGGLFGAASSKGGGGGGGTGATSTTKLAPVVSNYKNPKNHIIPIDVRMAAQQGEDESTTNLKPAAAKPTGPSRQQILKELMEKKHKELKQQEENAHRDRMEEQEAQQAKEEADAEAEGLAAILKQDQARKEQRRGETKEEREARIQAEKEERDRRKQTERELKRQEEKARRAGLTLEELEQAQQNLGEFDVEADERANESVKGGDGYETSLFDRGNVPKTFVYNHGSVKQEMMRQERTTQQGGGGAGDEGDDVFGAAQTLRGKRGREDLSK